MSARPAVRRAEHLRVGASSRWNNFREHYRYTGKEDDYDVGLVYFGARYYVPGLNRWASADPYAIHQLGGDLNPYAFTSGSPARYVDPTGLDPDDDDSSESGGSGGTVVIDGAAGGGCVDLSGESACGTALNAAMLSSLAGVQSPSAASGGIDWVLGGSDGSDGGQGVVGMSTSFSLPQLTSLAPLVPSLQNALDLGSGAFLGLIQGVTPFASAVNTSAMSNRGNAVRAGWGLGELIGGYFQAQIGAAIAGPGIPALASGAGTPEGAVAVGVGGAAMASGTAAAAQGMVLLAQAMNGGNGSSGGSTMFGSQGTQMTSKTVWKGDDGMRIDVENPNPGQRPGQIHFQQGDAKYLYDPTTKSFSGAPNRINALLETPDVQNAIAKGLRFLGEQ